MLASLHGYHLQQDTGDKLQLEEPMHLLPIVGHHHKARALWTNRLRFHLQEVLSRTLH